ncbi:MAG: histidine kinase [Alphaproteobacteria bacterium]|nr:histidine kinase [Alphaproteobacteria bacterium]
MQTTQLLAMLKGFAAQDQGTSLVDFRKVAAGSEPGDMYQPAARHGRRHPFPNRPSTWIAPSPLQKVLIIAVIWTAIGVFLTLPDMLYGFQWPKLVAKLVEAWAWALLTPAVLYADRKLSKFDAKPLTRSVILLLLSVPFSLTHVYLTGLLLFPIPAVWWNPLRSPDFAPYYFLGGWLTYCAIIGMLQTLRYFGYYGRYLEGQLNLERLEKRLLQSHLDTLRLQLEPHFLFNTLNAISSEVVSDPELARDMIENLGTLLRLTLDFKDSAEIALSQEIVLLEHYLAIQRVRFGNRIVFRIDVPPEVGEARVPCMLLQPIVENAVRHGVGDRISGGTIIVSALRDADTLEIRVEDDGVGLPPGWRMDASSGLGVKVTRERMAGLYSDADGAFKIQRRRGGGTEVIMRMPLRTTGGRADEPAAK